MDSDGEPILEPEVDISELLSKQKLDESGGGPVYERQEDEDDVDRTVAHIGSGRTAQSDARKGKVQAVEWDEELEELQREKAAFEATRELKSRFKARPDRLQGKPIVPKSRGKEMGSDYINAPALPNEAPRGEKEQMEDFLDDLLG